MVFLCFQSQYTLKQKRVQPSWAGQRDYWNVMTAGMWSADRQHPEQGMGVGECRDIAENQSYMLYPSGMGTAASFT